MKIEFIESENSMISFYCFLLLMPGLHYGTMEELLTLILLHTWADSTVAGKAPVTIQYLNPSAERECRCNLISV